MVVAVEACNVELMEASLRLAGALELTQPSRDGSHKHEYRSNVNFAKVTTDSVVKAGHRLPMYGLATFGLMAKKRGFSARPYRQQVYGCTFFPEVHH